jgi:hypothetical protein
LLTAASFRLFGASSGAQNTGGAFADLRSTDEPMSRTPFATDAARVPLSRFLGTFVEIAMPSFQSSLNAGISVDLQFSG